jgi:hypothetical protein
VSVAVYERGNAGAVKPVGSVFSLLGGVANVARRRVPGFGMTQRQVFRLERMLARELRALAVQLQSLGALQATEARQADGGHRRAAALPGSAVTPAEIMAELLHRSLGQTVDESRHQFFSALVAQLVPDEARIVAALSDGSTHAVIDVAPRQRTGGPLPPVLENASSVGKSAGVRLPAYVPAYISRLRMFGLVDIGPEDPSLGVEYDILATDEGVRAAIERAKSLGRLSPRMVRRSIRQSVLAEELWRACRTASQEIAPS